METVVDILNLLALLAFYFVLSSFLVQTSRLPGAKRAIPLGFATLVLVPVALGQPIYSAVPMVGGVGLALSLAPRVSRVRRTYVAAVVLAGSLILLDYLYDSGIPRFGLPTLGQLFNPELVYYSALAGLIGALVVAASTLLIFALAWWFVGLFSGSSRLHSRRRLITFVLASVLAYLVEPQLHENIHHPLGVHHPLFTLSTLLGGVVGYTALRQEVNALAIFDVHKPLAFSVVTYFSLYHFALDVYERTAGWMFDMPYAETAAVTFVLTIPYGVLLKQLVLGAGREEVGEPG